MSAYVSVTVCAPRESTYRCLSRVGGQRAVLHQAALHGVLQEAGQLLLVVLVVAAGRLDQHEARVAVQRRLDLAAGKGGDERHTEAAEIGAGGGKR